MEFSAVASGVGVQRDGVQHLSNTAVTGKVAAANVLSDFEKIFFDTTLHTSCADSPGLFSDQGIAALSVQEMSYWSIELHNSGHMQTAAQPASSMQEQAILGLSV
ncbi:MAG: hypothetical protein IJD16_02940 [Desulfovibrio sp.]|nr:hypothetical protein [Desulfovibrio sp.]